MAFTGGLVVVGAGQAFLIFWTLKATQTAANAAKESADGVIATERAYVFPGYDPITYSQEGRVTIPLVMTNVGKTPAVIKQVGYAFLDRVDLPASGTMLIGIGRRYPTTGQSRLTIESRLERLPVHMPEITFLYATSAMSKFSFTKKAPSQNHCTLLG